MAVFLCTVVAILCSGIQYSYYIPKAQRNPNLKRIKGVFRQVQDCYNEAADRYNWAIARADPDGTMSPLQVLNAVCFSAERGERPGEREMIFDASSVEVGINNRCTGCISHARRDFVGELKPSDRVIKGFAGSVTRKVQVGTLRWHWLDDYGKEHKF